MKTKRLFCLSILFILLVSLHYEALGAVKKKSTSSYAPISKKYPLIPGAFFQVKRKWNNSNIIWFWVHNDEYDAKANTSWAYQHLGGYGLFLINRSNSFSRNLAYYIKYRGRFLLDPNRMFHITGIKQNLTLLNKSIARTKRSRAIISYTWRKIGTKARRILLRYWSKNRPLIAVHNNRYLSIKAFRNDPKNFLLAEFDTNANSSFVFVVTKKHFQMLKECKVNTIYQLKPQKDGSLSDFAIQHHLPYLNVETKIGHREEQQKILQKIAFLLYPQFFNKNSLFKKNPCTNLE